MIRLSVAIALLALSVSACARNAPPSAPAAPASPPPAATAPAPQAAPDSKSAQISESQEATASQESGDATPDDKRDTSLERLAAMPADQQLPAGQWKPGVNYVPLVPAQPTNVAPGKVEVVEVFWYACPHCYALEPFIQNYLKNKPEYVEFVRVPVMWGPVHRAHARLFYILESLGRHDLHSKVFDTIHKESNMLVGNDDASTQKIQRDFAVAHGIKAEDFDKAWSSFSVNSNLQRAQQLTERYHVDGVPLIVVNGKYVTDVGKAGGPGQLLSLINDLAAAEKRR
ncbi:MAG TPA: thiol:disulfide interchange protein DsbA/DsbL [Steroidobacteraceae bacterium]|jgi:thiol:disulfide interchange protein DsbA|nr:thiol:disulfide interchange protein DsbA/DsbL [Steroidobacteraceae bacterium]